MSPSFKAKAVPTTNGSLPAPGKLGDLTVIAVALDLVTLLSEAKLSNDFPLLASKI